jgi:hypothetical protein
MHSPGNGIAFPAIDITIQSWRGDIINEVYYFDDYFYNRSDAVFREYCLNHKLADSNGNIHLITGVEDLKGWRKFVPFSVKRKMLFKRSVDKISLEELRMFMLMKIEELDDNDHKYEWIKAVKSSNTFTELFEGA